MKKLMTVLVAALFALSMTSAVFAEDKAPAASPSPAPKADAKKDEKKAAPAKADEKKADEKKADDKK
ncbi:MAG: hypothetical protein HQK99_07925 [Nitrospirae bacterium]|nr:hypothetical protein [Nitrospirota bacterium]